ncbi:hypothetical protein Pcinc_043973, partial [Petrolisthes cinctipes]
MGYDRENNGEVQPSGSGMRQEIECYGGEMRGRGNEERNILEAQNVESGEGMYPVSPEPCPTWRPPTNT